MQWRTPITLVVLLGILLGAAYYGWRTVVDPATNTSSPPTTPTTPPVSTKPKCLKHQTFPVGATTKATSFKVNVYNAGSVSGKAAEVLAALHSKGFLEGVADDPPSKVTASNVSILSLTPNSPRIRLVAEQFRGKVLVIPGPELAIGVDVIIGSDFVGLDPSAPTQLTLSQPATVCTDFATP